MCNSPKVDPLKTTHAAEIETAVRVLCDSRRVNGKLLSALFSGGPGSRRTEYCRTIALMYPGVVHVGVGEMLRDAPASGGDWSAVIEAMRDGKMAPEV